MSYSRLLTHRAMVGDAHRNALYAKAIRSCVTPDSAVLDLGAGLGLHGLVAAAAGARCAYLVDPEPVLSIAREIASANGLADRIVAVEGRIEDVELPEPVDIIVSVMTGNLLFTEDLLPSLLRARDRFLKPGGRMIPDFAHLVLVPVSATGLHAKTIGAWSERTSGLDFSAVRSYAANEILWLARDEVPADRLAQPAVASAIDVARATHCDCRGEIEFRVDTSGHCHGLLGWIELRIGEDWLSADPAGAPVHWSPGFLPIDPPLALAKGEALCVTLERPVQGDWTWTLAAAAGTRRQSTFLAAADSMIRLHRMAPDHRPYLSPRGENALAALTLMNTGHSNTEIAQILAAANPAVFSSIDDALQLARAMALRHGR